MKTDRELLELAAKAAGYSTAHYFDGEFMGADRYEFFDGPHGWSPLTDDGDALRLAVKLRLHISPEDDCLDVWHSEIQCNATEEYEPDPYAATRRAIVEAASAIGETL